MMNNRIVWLSICVALLFGVALVVIRKGESAANPASGIPAAVPTSTQPVTEPAPVQNTSVYKNDKYKFGLSYPEGLKVTETKEEGGAVTVTFESKDHAQGFDIYVIPYTESKVSDVRFHLDEPSGIMLQPTNVTIDGTQATMFFGHNDIMGDTREVWIIHGGFLYEIATYKELDPWLAQIMATWQFL